MEELRVRKEYNTADILRHTLSERGVIKKGDIQYYDIHDSKAWQLVVQFEQEKQKLEKELKELRK